MSTRLEREIRRLVDKQGLTEEEARVLASEPILDFPVGYDDQPLVPLPSSNEPITIPGSSATPGALRATEDVEPLVIRKPGGDQTAEATKIEKIADRVTPSPSE